MVEGPGRVLQEKGSCLPASVVFPFCPSEMQLSCRWQMGHSVVCVPGWLLTGFASTSRQLSSEIHSHPGGGFPASVSLTHVLPSWRFPSECCGIPLGGFCLLGLCPASHHNSVTSWHTLCSHFRVSALVWCSGETLRLGILFQI